MYREEINRGGDENAWEANDRDAMDGEDPRELYGHKMWKRDGGIEGWRISGRPKSASRARAR